MAHPFELGGDPAAIRASAQRWGTFSTNASGASSRIARMDTTEFVGTEGDQYRSALNSDMRPHLDTTAQAWSKVHGALHGYANILEDLQRRMATLAAKADGQQKALDHAQGKLKDSRAADFRHQFGGSDGGSGGSDDSDGNGGNGGNGGNDYHSHTPRYTADVSSAQHALQGSIDAANRIRAEHEAAVRTCCSEITAAKHMRFVKPPGWFSKALHSVGHWVSEHAGTLLKISAVLKTISGIAGVLALIPVLTPFMEPLAFVTGAAAFAIDLAVSAATGHWDIKALIMDGVGLIPGSKALMEMRTIQRLGKVGRGAEALAKNKTFWKVVDAVDSATNAGGSIYDFATAKNKDWEAYAALAVGLAGTKVPMGRKFKNKTGWTDRQIRQFQAFQETSTSIADAGLSGYDLGVKIHNGKAGWQDYLDTATKAGEAGGHATHLIKYHDPRGGRYTPGHQMHHKAYQAPDYSANDSKAAIKHAYRGAKHTLASMTNSSSHSGGGSRAAMTR